MQTWKNPLLLISGIGVSNLGNWIYFVAINLLILDLTGSPAAVAGLFIIRPLAVLVTNTWSGSLIDRMNNRHLMIITDVVRGILIGCIPFINSLWGIYVLMFIVNIAGSLFGPSSTTYMTKLVPPEKRKRFNSIFSFTSSGAFLVGPSISGLLIMYTSIDVCIFINAISFIVCALIIYYLPNVDNQTEGKRERITLAHVSQDWKSVLHFSKTAGYFSFIYLLFQIATLIGFALDSQEATFIKGVIGLTERDYGLLLSIAGGAYLAGSSAATLVANKISLRMFIGLGMILTAGGYFVFYSSSTLFLAAVGFIIFGVFSAFANTGYMTFFQNNVPINMMGRFSSTTNLIQAIIQIVFTLMLGFLAEILSLQFICLVFSGISIVISIVLCIFVYRPAKIHYYELSEVSKA
ncbi:MFS transporter [Bacillus sp. 31A1R]|uniref:MFS transporter n=1 Tax=Robertmurraya mangrovi TaxID=3098077 RepID=A0ABU5IWP1_9BACI|nr:MFS transporter [Bacillus sp. 31A1R]MDZ5471564.1 MFS transporter [Bacillus sp. 31A1R]